MQRYVTCPHCEQAFRIEYLVRPHPVEPLFFVSCPGCKKEVPNPQLAGDPPRSFTVCKVMSESDRPFGALTLALKWLRVCFWQLLIVRHPEWPLCLVLVGALAICYLSGSTV